MKHVSPSDCLRKPGRAALARLASARKRCLYDADQIRSYPADFMDRKHPSLLGSGVKRALLSRFGMITGGETYSSRTGSTEGRSFYSGRALPFRGTRSTGGPSFSIGISEGWIDLRFICWGGFVGCGNGHGGDGVGNDNPGRLTEYQPSDWGVPCVSINFGGGIFWRSSGN